MRKSTSQTESDSAGKYEIEIFDCPTPKSIIICVHGSGVRRWDGKHFFHNVAEHYTDRVFLLVDQNQVRPDGGCDMPALEIMVSRVQSLVKLAKTLHSEVPIIVLAHSHGCGVVTKLDTNDISKIILVAPTAGNATQKMIDRYGPDVLQGKLVQTNAGKPKYYTKAYVDSVAGIIWEEQYRALLQRYPSVYVFEAGAEEIIGEERKLHRDMPFAGYKIIPGAPHDLNGDSLIAFYKELDSLI